MKKQFDVQAARKAGMTGEQISQFMKQNNLTERKTMGGFLSNVRKSGGQLVSDLGTAVLNPVDTVKGVASLGSSVISNILPGEQGNEQLAKDVGEFYKDRYGSLDKAWETLYNDPVGMFADASTVLGGAGVVAKGARLGKMGSALSKASRATDPMRLPGKAVGAGRAGASKLGIKGPNVRGAIRDFGDNYAIKSTRIPTSKQNKLNKKLVGMNTRFGSTTDDLIHKTGLYGQNVDAIDNYIKPIQEQRTQAIRGSGLTVQNADILKNFSDEIAKLSTPEAMRDPASRLLRKKLIAEARAYAESNPVRRGQMSLESLDKTRAKIDSNTPNAQFESDKAAFQRSLGNVYRGTVNKAAGTGPAGKELSILYDFKDAVEKAPKGKNTLPMGITQSIATGAGFLSGSNPVSSVLNAGLSYGAAQAVNSPRFIGNVSKMARKASNAQPSQAVGNAYNKIPAPVRQGIQQTPGALYTGARVNRMLPPPPPPAVVPQSNRPMAEKKQDKKPRFTVEQFQQPKQKNVFNNNAAFGGNFSVKRGNFS